MENVSQVYSGHHGLVTPAMNSGDGLFMQLV